MFHFGKEDSLELQTIPKEYIYDETRNIVGFQPVFSQVEIDLDIRGVFGFRMFEDLLLSLSSLHENTLYPTFLPFTRDMLEFADLVRMYFPQNVVVDVVDLIEASEETCERISALRSEGYIFAFREHVLRAENHELLAQTDILRVDFSQLKAGDRKGLAQLCEEYSFELLAGNLQSEEDYFEALEYGYTLFQGEIFQKKS